MIKNDFKERKETDVVLLRLTIKEKGLKEGYFSVLEEADEDENKKLTVMKELILTLEKSIFLTTGLKDKHKENRKGLKVQNGEDGEASDLS